MTDVSKHKAFVLRLTFLLIGLLMFTGCYEVLYSNLDEKDINEIMAVLLKEGIACEKEVGAEQKWSIRVESKEFSNAISILKKYGLPRDKFQTIGDLFEKSGLISSPSEERIRFVHALSQEVSEAISQIDGVITARVQIVLPQNNPFDKITVPSSASVFIKYRKDMDFTPQVMKIKDFVVRSIEGLTFQNVTVALFPAEAEPNEKESLPFVTVCGLKIASESAATVKRTIGFLFTGLIGLSVFLVYRFAAAEGFKKRVIAINRRLQQKVQPRSGR